MESFKNSNYGSSDAADALVKLGITACFLPGITLQSPLVNATTSGSPRIVGLAHTVEFVLATNTSAQSLPPGSPHHVDCAPNGSVIVIKSPPQAINAVWGGLMSSRARHLGVAGVVVEGRIRDLNELRAANFIAFSSGTSTLGAAPYSRVSTLNQPITLAADSPWPVTVHPGDVIVGDVDGVVRIPADKIDQVLALCKTNSEMDGKCMADIEQGVTIREAFAKHRGK